MAKTAAAAGTKRTKKKIAAQAHGVAHIKATFNNIAVTPAQHDLVNLCSAMIGNALVVQGVPNPSATPDGSRMQPS